MFKSLPMSSYSDSSKPTTKFNNIGDVSLESIQSRMIPRQMVTGSTRGTQTVGYGGTKIDGSNNRITIENSSSGSSIGMGVIPDSTTNELGFFALDANDNLIMKIVDGTRYIYNPENDYRNVLQDGLLPDNTGGFIIVKEDTDVADVFDD